MDKPLFIFTFRAIFSFMLGLNTAMIFQKFDLFGMISLIVLGFAFCHTFYQERKWKKEGVYYYSKGDNNA